MKKFIQFCAAATLASLISASAVAQTTKPTKESLEKLFELTEVHAMIPQMQSQLDSMMNTMSQEMLKGKNITPEQQKALDTFRAKVVKIGRDEISWDVIQPRIYEIYSSTLSQSDVDGMIAFYQSPAGQSFIKKMPQIMNQTMVMMQKTSVPLMKKIEAAGNEFQQDMQRLAAPVSPAAAAAPVTATAPAAPAAPATAPAAPAALAAPAAPAAQ